MENTINKLTEKYRDDIREIFTKISNPNDPKLLELYTKNFGSTISEIFDISDLRGYTEYADILSELDKYDPLLSKRLEDYLIKEVNLVALLGLHVALKTDKDVTVLD